jgi:DNA-directed RNA polymerase I subunit RPA2
MYPSECRLRGINYSAQLLATVCRQIDDEVEEKITIPLGDIPVMVRSNFCNLAGLSEDDLVRNREDMHEFGGYFVVNGNEKIVRMLIVSKRNYPVCFSRGNF